MNNSYTRTARFEDNKLILMPHPSGAEMFRVVFCRDGGEEWLEVFFPGETDDCEIYTWAISPTLAGAMDAYADWIARV